MDIQKTNKNEPKITETNSTISATATSNPVATMNTSQSSSEAVLPANVWASTVPKGVISEKLVDAVQNNANWNALYSAIGGVNTDAERMNVRAAVYTYWAVNGTSRAGDYASDVTTGSGKKFNSSLILKACGMRDVRKWARACAKEAVSYYRATGVLATYPSLVNKCVKYGYGPDAVIGIVDFVGESDKLQVSEERLNQVAFANSIMRARGARDGNSLEKVENSVVDYSLHAQNGNNADRGRVIDM